MTPDPSSAAEVAATAAMARVLQAERDALAAMAECERLSATELEQARQRRRTLLERTQARIVALHARAAQQLERRAAEILERHLRSVTAEVEQLADPERRQTALERLAARLTTVEGETTGAGH